MVLTTDYLLHIEQGDIPKTITFDCERLEFMEKGILRLSLESHDFMTQFDEILFEAGDEKIVYKKEV